MDEPINFDFSGKSNEEVLSLFFHEIRSHVHSVVGYLSMLNLGAISEADTRKFTEIALKRAKYIQENVNQVFEYLDKQRKD